MLEYLRLKSRTPALTLRCYRCGTTRSIVDDGRRVHHAQVHQTSCTAMPVQEIEPLLRLVSADHLEVQLADGSVWLEIRRRTGA